MAKTNGYWVKGNLIKDATFTTHVEDIIKLPEAFGLTKESVEEAFTKHGERMGAEGKAREELIRKVSERGWIRVRHYSGREGDYWSVQFDEIGKREKAVKNFLSWATYEADIMRRADDARLVGYKDGYRREIRGVGEYLQEARFERQVMSLVASPREMLEEESTSG